MLRLAAIVYLGRFKGASRQHSASALAAFFTRCAGQDPAPLAAGRVDLERYVRWMQETRTFKPSTVSRRVSVVAGFFRTAVIDGLLEHSPAEHLRRPRVSPESPALGLTHLQFEALLTASSCVCSARAAAQPSSPCLPRSGEPSTAPPPGGNTGRSCARS